MPAVLLFNIIILSCVMMPIAVSGAEADWDPFTKMEADHERIGKPVVVEEVDEADDWPQSKVDWQENKQDYTLKVHLFNIDRKSVKVGLKDNGIMIAATQENGSHEKMIIGDNTLVRDEKTKGELNKLIRFPDDAELKLMTYRWLEDDLIVVVPKKRLKSII
jgi:HSP20 family molecular chaperone IbpA